MIAPEKYQAMCAGARTTSKAVIICIWFARWESIEVIINRACQTITRLKMSSRSRVRITVMRRFAPSEVFAKSPVTPVEPLKACQVYTDGQEFTVNENNRMPEGFCASAWGTIFPMVRTLSFGGNPPWYKEKGVAVECCTDGLRPVIFKLERI